MGGGGNGKSCSEAETFGNQERRVWAAWGLGNFIYGVDNEGCLESFGCGRGRVCVCVSARLNGTNELLQAPRTIAHARTCADPPYMHLHALVGFKGGLRKRLRV